MQKPILIFSQLLLNIIQGLVYRDFRDVIQSIGYEKLYTSAVVVLLGELDVSGKIVYFTVYIYIIPALVS